MLKPRVSLSIVIGLLLVFGAGLVHLFNLRFEQGDVYPAYSSLRTDPLGSKALYESLGELPGFTTARFYQPLAKLGDGRRKLLFVFGASPYLLRTLPQAQYESLQRFMLDGGRVVLTLYPEGRWQRWTNEISTTASSKKTSAAKPATNTPPTTSPTNSAAILPSTNSPALSPRPPRPRPDTNEMAEAFGLVSVSMEQKFGFEVNARSLLIDNYTKTRAEQVHVVDTESDLPRLISWHSAMYFDKLTNQWHAIYRRQTNAVLIERAVGAGSLVLASDSFFVSNEALRQERHPELLAWLAGRQSEVLFDESHLGLLERPGIAMLMRRYRLTGMIAGLMLVAALFIWKNAVSFVPPYEDDAIAGRLEAVEGRDSAAALANLLRRSIAPADILSVCVAEWKRSQSRGPASLQGKIKAVEAIDAGENAKPARARAPAQSYRAMQQIVTKKG